MIPCSKCRGTVGLYSPCIIVVMIVVQLFRYCILLWSTRLQGEGCSSSALTMNYEQSLGARNYSTMNINQGLTNALGMNWNVD